MCARVRTFLDLEELEGDGERLGVLAVDAAGDDGAAAVPVAEEHDDGRDAERHEQQHQEAAAAPHAARHCCQSIDPSKLLWRDSNLFPACARPIGCIHERRIKTTQATARVAN
jgi:hypothetical protein